MDTNNGYRHRFCTPFLTGDVRSAIAQLSIGQPFDHPRRVFFLFFKQTDPSTIRNLSGVSYFDLNISKRFLFEEK